MPDMLVKLYDLPDLDSALAHQRAQGNHQSPAAWRQRSTWRWIGFESISASVGSVKRMSASAPSIDHIPGASRRQAAGLCLLRYHAQELLGPTGVDEAERGRGIGTALLLACLHAMRGAGYMYGIIGWAGPVAYYQKAVGAEVIPDAEPPGSYRGLLGTDAIFNQGRARQRTAGLTLLQLDFKRRLA